MQKLLELYRKWSGSEPSDAQKLAGAGSNREYYRLAAADGTTIIGVVGTSREENHAFIALAGHFGAKGLGVPTVLAVSDDEERYLQTDLGSTALFDAIAEGRKAGGEYSAEEKELIRKTILALPDIQIRGAEGLDFGVCYPQAEFDEDNIFFDLNYFKYCFLKATGLDFHEVKLEADFKAMARDLMDSMNDMEEGRAAFMYRDFQARNVMVDAEANPSFIDFQGGRKGPFYYDIVSFLWQASAKYPPSLRREMTDLYYRRLSELTAVPTRDLFDRRISLFVLFRTMQVLGAYGFRGYFERKLHFIDSIPPAIQNLRELLAAVSFPYRYMQDMLRRLTEMPQFAAAEQSAAITDRGEASVSKYDGRGPLVVRVFSFSFKRGIPHDDRGNGGGYVFDCRSTHNPGRYEPYKPLTGLDEPVIRFLEDDGEILTFLDSVYKLADAHVERYMKRGFTDLMFSFGCTGGRHRSVYSAQHLAERLNSKYGIEVRLCHREQNINQILQARQ